MRWRSFLVACVALGALAGCRAASEDVDAGDLLGVFAHDGGSDAGVDGGKPPTAKRVRDAGAPRPAAPAEVRAPIQGSCVAPEGEANREIKKTLGRPACRDAQVLEWTDALGSPRYACVVQPKGIEARAPLPLVIFFHDAFEEPTMVGKKTLLGKLAQSFDLASDPAHHGFFVLSLQGRAIDGGRRGSVFDTAFTGEGNVDVAATDHFLAEVEAKGFVDKRRIYALGAATGGQMAELYAMARPDRVAAFGTFAAEPLGAKWSCDGPAPPAVVMYRACDAVAACDRVETSLHAREASGAETVAVRLGDGNEEEPNCAFKAKCKEGKGTANHRRWPKGREEVFLKFFAKHALGEASPAEPAP